MEESDSQINKFKVNNDDCYDLCDDDNRSSWMLKMDQIELEDLNYECRCNDNDDWWRNKKMELEM